MLVVPVAAGRASLQSACQDYTLIYVQFTDCYERSWDGVSRQGSEGRHGTAWNTWGSRGSCNDAAGRLVLHTLLTASQAQNSGLGNDKEYTSDCAGVCRTLTDDACLKLPRKQRQTIDCKHICAPQAPFSVTAKAGRQVAGEMPAKRTSNARWDQPLQQQSQPSAQSVICLFS